jgi:hypothetical protein
MKYRKIISGGIIMRTLTTAMIATPLFQHIQAAATLGVQEF